jgi:hypothetical protein
MTAQHRSRLCPAVGQQTVEAEIEVATVVAARFTAVEAPKQLLKTQTGEPNDDG